MYYLYLYTCNRNKLLSEKNNLDDYPCNNNEITKQVVISAGYKNYSKYQR